MPTTRTGCDALEDYLAELEVDAALLRRDPVGRTWLPRELFEIVQTDSHARVALRDFVHGELELFAAARAGADPFFTARVVARLPASERGRSERRTWILATCHALAVGVGYLLVRPALTAQGLSVALESVHGWLDRAVDTGLLWPAVIGFALAAWFVAGSALERAGAALPRT